MAFTKSYNKIKYIIIKKVIRMKKKNLSKETKSKLKEQGKIIDLRECKVENGVIILDRHNPLHQKVMKMWQED